MTCHLGSLDLQDAHVCMLVCVCVQCHSDKQSREKEGNGVIEGKRQRGAVSRGWGGRGVVVM